MVIVDGVIIQVDKSEFRNNTNAHENIISYIQRTLTCVFIGHIYYTQILFKIQQNSKIRREERKN